MELNKTFSSYDDLQNAINSFEKEKRVQFWKRDAKTLNSAEHHSPNLFKRAPQELRYYKLKYACIYGGQKFRPKKNKKGHQRSHQGTLKKDCKAHITIGLNTDGKSLIVRSINNDHNHEIPSEELFKQLPKQRRLTNENKQNVEMMMKLKVNKKLLQADLVKKSGNAILLKDLSNICTSSSQKLNYDFEEIVQKLIIKYNCTVDFKTEDTKLSALFFQDAHMKKSFYLFPEILFLDGTYKLINIRCPVYVMAVENSLGTTDVVGIGILTSEDVESISWMLEKFKERNNKWEEITVILTDKCSAERQAISEQLPNASKLICIFHTLQIFRREITAAKLNITSVEVVSSLHHLQKMVYAKSEEHYTVLLEEMKNNIPKSVLQYYMKNWHVIRNEWVKGLTAKTGNFLNSTNNRLESLNSKLKSVISTYSTFDEFIEKLFVLLNIKRTQFQNELSKMIFKSPCIVNKTHTEVQFYKHVTPFAFKKIEGHLQAICSSTGSVRYKFKNEGNKVICCTDNKYTKCEVSDLTCDCCFFTSMKLPCKHVLAYRKQLGLELFDENLFSQRWTRNYIESNSNVMISNPNTLEPPPITETRLSMSVSNTKPLTSHQKFKKSEALCLNLATLCSEVSTEEFHKRMKLLMELQNKWQNHEHVSFESSNNQENLFIQNDFIETNPERCVSQSPTPNEVFNENELEHSYFCNKVISDSSVKNTNKQIFSKDNDLRVLNEIICSVDKDECEVVETVNNPEISYQEIIIETVNTEINFKDITLPDPIKCRGRPKGQHLTAIGLPKKRRQSLQGQHKTKKKKV